MICIFTVEAPDGKREIVNANGDPVAMEDAQPFTGSLIEANEELGLRMGRWSARGDCFVRHPEIEPAT